MADSPLVFVLILIASCTSDMKILPPILSLSVSNKALISLSTTSSLTTISTFVLGINSGVYCIVPLPIETGSALVIPFPSTR